MKLERNFV